MIIWQLTDKMQLDFSGVVNTVRNSGMDRIFVFDDWQTKQNFFKQFFSGIFITIVMTGLDQDMMQKNLSIRTLKASQKNMYFYGVCFSSGKSFVSCLGDFADYVCRSAANSYTCSER